VQQLLDCVYVRGMVLARHQMSLAATQLTACRCHVEVQVLAGTLRVYAQELQLPQLWGQPKANTRNLSYTSWRHMSDTKPLSLGSSEGVMVSRTDIHVRRSQYRRQPSRASSRRHTKRCSSTPSKGGEKCFGYALSRRRSCATGRTLRCAVSPWGSGAGQDACCQSQEPNHQQNPSLYRAFGSAGLLTS
jgi:hypothetical protein